MAPSPNAQIPEPLPGLTFISKVIEKAWVRGGLWRRIGMLPLAVLSLIGTIIVAVVNPTLWIGDKLKKRGSGRVK